MVNLLEGVYWDMDGTIANTELEAHLPAFNKAFNDFNLGWYWDNSKYINLLKINGGRNRISYFSRIKNLSLTENEIQKIHERKQYHYLELIKKNTVILKPGVLRLIKELNNRNIRQFIVTSSSKQQVQLLVEKLFPSLNPFEFIIASDDVRLHKPNPLPYLKAINLSGINISNSVVFEDSNAGLTSSLAAKLPTIYFPSNIPMVIDKEININCIIGSLGNINEMAKVIKGPKLEKNIIDYSFLNKFLMIETNAED